MTADLRREEITRIAAVLETTVLVSNADRVAAKLYDAGLRSQDTATARIVAILDSLLADFDRWMTSEGQPDFREKILEARAVLSGETRPSPANTDAGLDVGPELMAWFHESEEICEHDAGHPWPCQIMADHLLRAFTVEPRLTDHPDGTTSFEARHFHRLDLAARLATPDKEQSWEPTEVERLADLELNNDEPIR